MSRRHVVWRRIVVAYVVGAIALTSLGPWPWLFASAFVAHHPAAHEHRHVDAGAIAQNHDDCLDVSDIPGSPTHPIDHQCAPCEVLKHLARCVPSVPSAPHVAVSSGTSVAPLVAAIERWTDEPAALPPARGPPRDLG